MIKSALFIGLAIAIVYSILFIIQMWTTMFDLEIFFKISVTFGVLGLVDLITIGVLFTVKENDELKKGNHIG